MPNNSRLKRKISIAGGRSDSFTSAYKESCFYVWYGAGRPVFARFYDRMPVPLDRSKPSKVIAARWFTEWQERADFLDEQVKQQIEAKVIAEKVEMLEKHAEIGKNMQEVALTLLDKLADQFKPPDVVRLLVEGIRIEKESVGVPAALKALLTKDDDTLLTRINELLDKGSRLEPESEFESDESY